jgi:hypothetical protein
VAVAEAARPASGRRVLGEVHGGELARGGGGEAVGTQIAVARSWEREGRELNVQSRQMRCVVRGALGSATQAMYSLFGRIYFWRACTFFRVHVVIVHDLVGTRN